jgi:hypothetical protein
MDPEQFYLFWKILVLTLESILPKLVRRLILTGFGTRAKRALMHPKSTAEKLDSRTRGIMKPRKQKRNPSMRLVLSNWEHELSFGSSLTYKSNFGVIFPIFENLNVPRANICNILRSILHISMRFSL